MNAVSLLWITGIAAASIGLNILLKRTAEHAVGFADAVLSRNFALAFSVGTCAALLMLGLYLSRIDLGRAILLMGALSILGGTMIGVVCYRERLDGVEWGIFAALALLYAYRSYRLFAPSSG